MIEVLKRPVAAVIASVVLLTSLLGAMVFERVQHLRNGREIVLAIRPVDPRDLFKGDYVRLGYDIASPKPDLLTAYNNRRDLPVFVLIEQGATDPAWTVVAVTEQWPVTVAANQVVLTAKANYRTLQYGIERYYIPEGTGPKLEDQARTGKLAAIVAINSKGKAAIKGLMLDGKKIYDEPLL
jgi:uncharacterized membrane-anchored protein